MMKPLRVSVYTLLIIVCLASCFIEAEEPALERLMFCTYPSGAEVYIQDGGEGLSYIGKSGTVITRNMAKLKGQSGFDVQFKLWGYVPVHQRFQFVKNTDKDEEVKRYPADSDIQLQPKIPVIIPLIYLVRDNVLITIILVVISILAVFLVILPKRRKVKAALDRAAKWEAIRTKMGDDDPHIGLKLGEYRLIEKLGSGGMGAVYKAVPEETLSEKESVAIKFMKPEVTEDEEFVRRFRREVQVTSKLDHPSILRIINWGEEDKRMYMVMELMKGSTLKGKMGKGGMSIKSFRDYYFPVLDALEYAHGKDIIHRDIKPDNIMLTENGRVKVMDFGLAKGNQYSTITVSGSAIGTPAYMAPEQITGKPQDSRSDQYSLGVLAWEMLAGHRPFDDESTINIVLKHLSEKPPSLKEARPDLPDAFNAIIMRMLEKEPNQRYKNLGEVKSAMEQVLASVSSK